MKNTPLNAARLLLLSLALMAAPIHAAVIFDFTSSNPSPPYSFRNYYPQITMWESGLQLTITPKITHDPNGTATPTPISLPTRDPQSKKPIGVYTGTTGLGIRSYNNTPDGKDGKSIDGSYSGGPGGVYYGKGGVRDLLVLQFTSAVTLNSIRFSGFGSGTDFNLNVDGANELMDIRPAGVGTGAFWYTLPTAVMGTEFIIWADGANDKFRVAGLDVTAVPLPPAVLLLISGLMGLGYLTRRQRN